MDKEKTDILDITDDDITMIVRLPGVVKPLYLPPDTEITVKLGGGKLLNVRVAHPPERGVAALVISSMGRGSHMCVLPMDRHLVAIKPSEN